MIGGGWHAFGYHILFISQGDHRKVYVRKWVEQRRYTIEQVCGINIRETDFSDDRLAILLKRLSNPETWQYIECFLTQNTIRAYDLSVKQVRLDATTISGHHLISEGGLFQYNPKKQTNKPTAERLLRAFSNLTLTIIEVRGERFGYVPPLNLLQQEIISLLGLSPDIYSGLVDNSS